MEVYIINKNSTVTKNLSITGLGNESLNNLFSCETMEEIINHRYVNQVVEEMFRIGKLEYSSVTSELNSFTFFFWNEEKAEFVCIIDALDKGRFIEVSFYNPKDFGDILKIESIM